MTIFKTLRGSLSFRLTLNYGLLSILTTLILIAFIHAQVIDALRGEHARQITATAQRLSIVFEEAGRTGLIAAIELTLSDRIDADREVYLLLDERGRKLAGNLDFLPPTDAKNEEIFATLIDHNGQTSDGYLRLQALPDGATLVVGHDAGEIAGLTSLIGRAAAVALFLAACLVMLATYAFRRTLDYRVGQIRRTTQQIRAGQLSRRIPPDAHADDDEFSLLNRDINAMLDRIEALMTNARHLSDTIAHNLRTPLTHISGALQSAQRAGSSQADASKAELADANQTAIDGIARVNALLEKLLQIADMQAGIRRRAFKPCRLDEIAADVIDMYEPLAEDRGIRLARKQFDAVTVQGDANLLASAIANVVDNAIKYAKSQVTIRVFRQGNHGCVVIADNGPGLPDSEYAQLGKHFYRADATSDGHGLGLTSVLEIIRLHDGTVSFGNAGFNDTNPGLRVTVSLPYTLTLEQPGLPPVSIYRG